MEHLPCRIGLSPLLRHYWHGIGGRYARLHYVEAPDSQNAHPEREARRLRKDIVSHHSLPSPQADGRCHLFKATHPGYGSFRPNPHDLAVLTTPRLPRLTARQASSRRNNGCSDPSQWFLHRSRSCRPCTHLHGPPGRHSSGAVHFPRNQRMHRDPVRQWRPSVCSQRRGLQRVGL